MLTSLRSHCRQSDSRVFTLTDTHTFLMALHRSPTPHLRSSAHIQLSEIHFLPLSLSLHHTVLRPARSSRSSVILLHACFGILVRLHVLLVWFFLLSSFLHLLYPSFFASLVASSQSRRRFDSSAQLLVLSLLSRLQRDGERRQPADPGRWDGGGARRGFLSHAGQQDDRKSRYST